VICSRNKKKQKDQLDWLQLELNYSLMIGHQSNLDHLLLDNNHTNILKHIEKQIKVLKELEKVVILLN